MVVLDPARPRCAGTASGSRRLSYAEVVRLARTITVARMLERDDFATPHGRPAADLGLRAALSADAGLRLGRRRGRRRARRHRPALQPARRARGDGALRPRAPGRPDDAAAALLGRREDELVGRQQHPAHRGARRDVRAHDADPRRADAAVVAGSSPSASRRRSSRWSRSSRSPASSSRARTAPRRRAAAEERFTRVVRRGEAPAEVPEVAASRRATRSTCRRCSSPSFGVRSTSEARRLVEQGGVKLGGEVVAELDLERARWSGRCCRSASAASAGSSSRRARSA